MQILTLTVSKFFQLSEFLFHHLWTGKNSTYLKCCACNMISTQIKIANIIIISQVKILTCRQVRDLPGMGQGAEPEQPDCPAFAFCRSPG